MLAAKLGAGTTDDRSGIVYALEYGTTDDRSGIVYVLEYRFRGR